MSIWKKIKALVGVGTIAAVEAFALTEAQKAVAALKNTLIGSTVAKDIKALSSSTMSGQQKFEAVLTNTLPLITELLSDGGVKKTTKEVEDIGRALVQSVFNDVASSKAAGVASAILKLLGLK